MSAAQHLHREALVIDSHNDTIVAHIRCGNIGLKGEQGPERRPRAGLAASLSGDRLPDHPSGFCGLLRSPGLQLLVLQAHRSRDFGRNPPGRVADLLAQHVS